MTQLKAATVVAEVIVVQPQAAHRRALQLHRGRQRDEHLDGGEVDLVVRRLFTNARFGIDCAACE